MILTDTLNQPKALAIYAILGATFGVLHAINNFTCAYLIKNAIYRHVSQSLYAIVYGLSVFCATYVCFDYSLKVYHVLISLFFTALTSIVLYLPVKKHSEAITQKCNVFRTKIAQSKFVTGFKK